MPSAITHAVTGAALSTLAPRRYRGVGLGVLLAALAAAPDLDVIGFRVGIPYAHPLGHRGFTHSLICALLVALPLTAFLTRGAPRRGRSEVGLLTVIFLAAALHGVFDMLTDAGLGIGLFIPFDDRRYFLPWRPVRTSPLGIAAFFNGDGIAILRNEMTWIWLPVATATAIVLGWRWLHVNRGGRQ